MKKKNVPAAVSKAIREAATDIWGDDEDMIADIIASEEQAYRELQELDFGAAEKFRRRILDGAFALHDDWEQRLSAVRDELAAHAELQGQDFRDVPAAEIVRLKKEAAKSFKDSFTEQRDHVAAGVSHYLYVRDLEQRIEPMKGLLIEMERMIGSACYNANIQNFGPGGVWEGEGRSFRYPVRFLDGDDSFKRSYVPEDIAPEVLVTGCYRFGSNELGIFRALLNVVEMLERDYGVRLRDADRKG
ncbi:MAG: hypothetical protein F9K19_19590 [Rhizobiaceae bacterium]|nr:MAG: hypothetical protein F9K19_19590 [Rhizobiaceae bacterium]CAG1005912.1 hypothetical protein RHIZO_03215 [Rhizobiaceae bacterium]